MKHLSKSREGASSAGCQIGVYPIVSNETTHLSKDFAGLGSRLVNKKEDGQNKH